MTYRLLVNEPHKGWFMVKEMMKRDRTARLLRLQFILWQHQKGMEIKQICELCSVSERTAYRDLEALENELKVPLWAEHGKHGVLEGYFLPPLTFTHAEAMNIFLAARLMQNLSLIYNPSIASTFIKLSTIVPPPLQQQIHNTIAYMESLPRKERTINNLNKITEAWLSQHKIKITYRETTEKPVEHIVDTYFIEPISRGRLCYILGYSDVKKSIFTFIVNNIVGDVIITGDRYEIPQDFNAMDYLSVFWGPFRDNRMVNLKLLFKKDVRDRVIGNTWHQSEIVTERPDGTVIMEIRLMYTAEVRNWILSWVDDVEVLEPPEIRQEILRIGKSFQEIYSDKK
jgi:predicted DNA-binding transcriptional regulator YafY